MTPEPDDQLRLEIGHVLFIDIVGYSKLLIEEQKGRLHQLTEIVLATEQVRKAPDEQLVRLPTGDGMALVFRNSAEEPARCALEVAQALKSHPEIDVRIGIHSGPVSEVTDVSGRNNIAGAGINVAQRVMDCGDAGHVLLSRHVAEDLEHYGHWQPLLHDLGECEVKHGVRLGIVNLYKDRVGNPQLPKKFQALKRQRARKRWAGLAALLLLGAMGGAFMIISRKPARLTSTVPEKSIAVLPFENLSDDKSNAYFAEGIQDEILTKLASIADLKVISRTSTAKYQSKPDDLKTISQQLGVANIVEGTVQRAADQVRVNVQLIDARADTHLWAKTYDRAAKDVFAVESEVSQEIADALQAKLSPNEANTVASAPTKDPEAYDMFLKGEYAQRAAEASRKLADYEQAGSWYQQAIARDPHFALAMAKLAENEMWQHWYFKRVSESELEQIKSRADRALQLAPDLAEGHIALGLNYYLGHRQYDQALAEFQRALELQPNNVPALDYAAHVHRRQGHWKQHLSEMTKCEELDPRNTNIPAQIGASYCRLRMWDEAKRAGLRSLALDPHNLAGMETVIQSCLNGTGDIEKATRLLASFPAESLIARSEQFNSDISGIIGQWPYLYVIKRDYGAALATWEKERSNSIENRDRLVARAAIHLLAPDASNTTTEIESTRALVEARLHEQPDDRNALTQLSFVNAALQDHSAALTAARRASELMPPEKDDVEGPEVLAGLAEIEARTGQSDEAIKTLREVLMLPAGIVASIARLKIDPVWDPIRKDPGFQQLLAGPELIGPNK
ncbi:MAG TPA: adenylate/guanylate cyclase domain-containing protein [Chthoniobacterales bacterium]|jgi:serine/threonine-protein kinase